MSKCYLPGVLIMACFLFAAFPARGQQRAGSANQPAQAEAGTQSLSNPTYDDDGGRVFIVERDGGRALQDLKYHGGKVISAPRQYSIFLGNAWSDNLNKTRQPELANLLGKILAGREGARGPSFEQTLLRKRGVSGSLPPSLVLVKKDPVDAWNSGDSGSGPMSDLQVQTLLSGLFEGGVVGTPDEDTVYTVFLPPGAASTLGGLFGGKHYLAYHNFFHLDGVEVHYIVMPYQANGRIARSTVKQALIDTILNPSGDGWY